MHLNIKILEIKESHKKKKGGGIGEADNVYKCSKQLSMHQTHVLVGSIY